MVEAFFSYIQTTTGAMHVASIGLLLCGIASVCVVTRLNPIALLMSLAAKILQLSLRLQKGFIAKSETKYHRDLEVGRIQEKRTKYKVYNFLNDLIIDLGYSHTGIKPYGFLFMLGVSVFLLTLIFCWAVFSNVWMTIPFFPIFFVGVVCTLYTRANIAHDTRIEAVIEAENIVCNTISAGTIVQVRESLNAIPKEVRPSFENFLTNVEDRNYHIKTALQQLNNELGSTADDFIKKCIVFEMEEQKGVVGVFKDVVEMNNIKMELRTEMKRRFEEVTQNFIMGASMIFIFMIGVLIIYENVRSFYLTTVPGQLIIGVDALIMIAEYVYITYLRAKEI